MWRGLKMPWKWNCRWLWAAIRVLGLKLRTWGGAESAQWVSLLYPPPLWHITMQQFALSYTKFQCWLFTCSFTNLSGAISIQPCTPICVAIVLVCERGCSAHCGCAQLAPSKRCSLSMYPNSCGEMIVSLGNTCKVGLAWIDLTWQWQHCRQYLYSVNNEQTADRSVPVMVPSKGERWVRKHLPSQDQLTSSAGSEAGGAPHLAVSRKVQFEL